MKNPGPHDHIPLTPVNQVYVDRPRVDALLENALRFPVVSVVAGAGYGKSHAVYSYLRRQEKMLTTWLQLSERDNIMTRFWENFIDSVKLHNPDIALRLTEFSFPNTDRQFDRYLTLPSTLLRPGEKYVMVFDDFHLLRNEQVIRFIERSINVPFANIITVIISRGDPPINTMGFLSKGILARINEEELRFTQEEIFRYFEKAGVRLRDEALSRIREDTEGWAFAIRLVGLALRHEQDQDAEAVYDRSVMKLNIFNIIEKELFSTVSGELQKFLIKLSLIDHHVRELLLDIAGSQELIDELDEIRSFIYFDIYFNAYRIHHLFNEYLAAKQDLLSREEKNEVYLKTAAWCDAHNLKTDAVSCYEKAGDYKKFIETVNRFPPIPSRETALFLLEVMDRAPPAELYGRNVTAHSIHVRLLIALGRLREAEDELRGVIAENEQAPLSAEKSFILCGCYNYLGFLGNLTCLHTHKYDFARYFERAHDYFSSSGAALSGPSAAITLSSYAVRVGSTEQGNMEKYIEAVNAASPHMAATMRGYGSGIEDLTRAELAFFRGDMGSAEELLRQALHKGQSRNQYEIQTRALFYLLRVSLFLGETAVMRDLLDQIRRLEDIADFLNRHAIGDIVMGWFYIHIGMSAKIAPWLQSDFEESELNSRIYDLESLVKLKGHFREKRYQTVLSSLEKQKNHYGIGGYVFGRLEMKVLEAASLFHLGSRPQSFLALAEAYDLAASNSLEMPFIEMGKDMSGLIGEFMKDENYRQLSRAAPVPPQWLEKIERKASAYAKKLSMVPEQFKKNGNPEPVYLLTRRERGVLEGLSEGHTREAIAGETGLSINNIKSVIKSIYGKLGAVNRADAIRIATKLGIIKKPSV
ncbi:MAG: LuxR C-terminal-related transcriptional regulator [Treponema sp.]|jgi:LuxR family maltose regulon positive regulatory protein|nr:LuxR C-terminal-related transcriptional regulator [Treponema sp.]